MTVNWQPFPSGLRLAKNTIDIWRTPLDLPQQKIDGYRSVLSEDELQRARRFKVKRKNREYIISRGLLRTVLGKTLNSDPRELVFRYTEHDKPYIETIEQGLPVKFNVSHSHNQTLIAVTLGNTVGIDIERIRQNVEFRKLATRFFSRQEGEELNTYTDTGIPRAFFACWTRKEAFVKALGDGISFGLSEFSVSTNPYDNKVVLTTHWNEQEAQGWSLVNIIPDDEYIAALAINGLNQDLRYWKA